MCHFLHLKEGEINCLVLLSKCTERAMPCGITNKEGDEETKVSSLTSDFRLPDTLAFVPMGTSNTKKTRNQSDSKIMCFQKLDGKVGEVPGSSVRY